MGPAMGDLTVAAAVPDESAAGAALEIILKLTDDKYPLPLGSGLDGRRELLLSAASTGVVIVVYGHCWNWRRRGDAGDLPAHGSGKGADHGAGVKHGVVQCALKQYHTVINTKVAVVVAPQNIGG